MAGFHEVVLERGQGLCSIYVSASGGGVVTGHDVTLPIVVAPFLSLSRTITYHSSVVIAVSHLPLWVGERKPTENLVKV
jgi:ketopantoate hydroxymethyltransferase